MTVLDGSASRARGQFGLEREASSRPRELIAASTLVGRRVAHIPRAGLLFSTAIAAATVAAGTAEAACSGNVCTVTVGADSGTSSAGVTGGVGTLSDAIAFANAQSGPVTIDIETNVTLSGPHSPIPNANVTINGGNKAITSTTQRILFVGTDTGSKRASDSAFKGHVDVSFW